MQFVLENENYVTLRHDRRGLLRSQTFPGLVLDMNALLSMNGPKVLAVLQRGLASTAHKKFVVSLR